ncbi:MAG: hypothetical protein SGJ19_24060 [Planctomycetia bacterium]|nr:hypothetical protein [Planctomycetia bacterium]
MSRKSVAFSARRSKTRIWQAFVYETLHGHRAEFAQALSKRRATDDGQDRYNVENHPKLGRTTRIGVLWNVIFFYTSARSIALRDTEVGGA